MSAGSVNNSGSSSSGGSFESVTIESKDTGDEKDPGVRSVRDQVVDQLEELEEESRGCSSLCKKVSAATTSLIVAGGAGAVSVLQSSWFASASLAGRVVGTVAPFSSGAALATFFSAVLPPSAMRRLRIEAWRMGIPLYFLLTEIYLNLNPDESSEETREQEAIISAMTVLAGFEIASWVDGLVRSQFGGTTFSYLPISQGDTVDESLAVKKFKILGENHLSYFLSREVAYIAAGSGLILSSYYIPFSDPKVAQMEFDFGAFYLGEALALPLARLLIKWGEGLEEKYERDLDTDSLLEVPKNLQNWRIVKKLISFFGPVGTYTLLLSPDWYTLAPSGALHGIEEEMRRSLFAHRTIQKVEGVQKMYLPISQNLLNSRNVLRVARLISELGGLSYFMYNAIESDTPIDWLIGGSIAGSAVVGYTLSFWVDRTFTVEKSSTVMQNLFYRLVYSDSILGIDLLLPYWYIFNKGIDIGTADLSSVSNVFLALIYICYAGRAGRDMAVLDTDRYDPVVPRISKWLLANNIILLYDIASKKVV